MTSSWRACSTCKKEIPFGQTYYICSVSTCQSKATNYVFCGIACWDAHVPVERHRSESAGALERRAPKAPEGPAEGKRKIIATAPVKPPTEEEILVVVSKVRKYVADRSGMNTSAGVYSILTDKIKELCDRAIEEARAHGRKTVMDRDVH
jgi:hypothetical protein